MKKAKVYYDEKLAGYLEKTDSGYRFLYYNSYIKEPGAKPVSLTLPISIYPYNSNILFPFFDGLIPEGWLLNIAKEYWNFKSNDRFELLATLCRDTIGAVTVIGEEEENE
ncbi:HipA N-terminal domain-containing protein [Pedobacter sp.]|jgi:serine/threonine-protein kinase HipA|uniref:HipA N-terminal domain-containing protein n=1 Tax=Pedobacter sp. TaxID=1411316 RepID=UPI002C057AFE|nr:HipA N-terminal domain-containing protein [Pedobacter sp.]HWW42971.1 HipA N-terminal domain-containing protein [Pedobacter sp.]